MTTFCIVVLPLNLLLATFATMQVRIARQICLFGSLSLSPSLFFCLSLASPLLHLVVERKLARLRAAKFEMCI